MNDRKATQENFFCEIIKVIYSERDADRHKLSNAVTEVSYVDSASCASELR